MHGFYHLRITNPIINNRDDPFIDLSLMIDKLGREEAQRMALKFADDVQYTGNWEEYYADEYTRVAELLATKPEEQGLMPKSRRLTWLKCDHLPFDVASATALPWPDRSMYLCIAPALIEHVTDWRRCLAEFVRVLKPGGALYQATSNVLCSVQEEFKLPLVVPGLSETPLRRPLSGRSRSPDD